VRKAWLALALVGVSSACHGSAAQQGRPPTEPSARVPAVAAAGADAGQQGGAADHADDGMPRLQVVLDDPRLAAARAFDVQRDSSAAAREVDAARATATLDAAQSCAWAYTAGRLHLAAGESGEAAAAFEGAFTCPLAPYAFLREAQALVRAGRHDEALARARAVDDTIALRDEARLVLADAYAGTGDRVSAVPIWRGLLAASPSGLRWADVSLLLANALLDGVDGPATARAQEALDLATRVLVEAPWVAEKTDVDALRTRAATALGRGPAPALTLDERARQAQAWLDFKKPRRAADVADSLLQVIPAGDKKHADTACRAATLRALAVPHGKHEETADAWGTAIARCEGDDSLPNALYQGGKASGSAHRPAEARSRFERVEKLFPDHRLADDARCRSALLAYDQGDEARYVALLSSIPDAYPDGDMKGEALFRVALVALTKRDLDGARSALDRLLPIADVASGAQARAAYFRARVAQLAGDADARARYEGLVAEQPLAYYMLLAYARLRAMDGGAASSAMQAAVAREPQGPFLTHEHPELATPAFARFVALLEVGEVDVARREAAAAGWTADGADAEVEWTIAWLYDRAGAPDVGHAFARGRLLEYRAHWPAGRWRLPWQTSYPRPWDDVVQRESEAATIPVALTWAIMREESAFDPDAHSPANAQGLMQLMAPTARLLTKGTAMVIDDTTLHRPDVSIALGARYLGMLRVSFATNPALAIAAYNGGSGAVRRWLGERGSDDFDVFVERIPFDETRAYIKRVLSSEAAYAFLYAPKALDEILALPQRASGQDAIAAP
jgi:soluble lytic murein transglycosylase